MIYADWYNLALLECDSRLIDTNVKQNISKFAIKF